MMNLLKFSLFILIFFITGCKKEKSDLPELGTCQSVTPATGFVKIDEERFRFESSGGAILTIGKGTNGALTLSFGYSAFSRFSVEWWGAISIEPGFIYGAYHENLMGKHIKDRIGNNRTMLYPDGTKITCVSAGPQSTVTAISIYDGNTAHHLNVVCGAIEYSASNGEIAKALDRQQADGETSSFEITPAGLNYFNIYNEATPGNKVNQRIEMGKLYNEFPNRVDDLYDDPRLAHT